MDKSPTNVQGVKPPADETYEVRRSLPQHGDSFIGGLDILTIHRMIEEQDAENEVKEPPGADESVTKPTATRTDPAGI